MKEPLVLLPEMMCDARLFGPQIAELSSDTAVMVAPITMGERIEEIASALLDILPKRFALAGLSMGAVVAMEILRRAPDRVTRIALIDTHPLAETPVIAANREPQIVKVRSGRLMEVMREEMSPTSFAPGPYRNEVLGLVMDMAQTLGPEVYIRQSRALQRRKDQQATLRRCKVPALILCGAYDNLYPVKRHEFMAELVPYAQLRVLEHSGHLPTLEQPDETTAALREWLAQPYVLQ
ncbi:alpha/beta fold hydrolase [Sulfitobacter donghicola]|uniref:Alpha/beta hydrolase n=1 Tax=Sulfitobacter donghicola DSW-25 = KCTC 12864 = JCM 14565 TaxID=1300350 RepID=A0A073II06_9RHOB|nr:alpha/beta fold hydrolase [Sulfitobacter donghicola]KEJ89968.1 alpha/beta hydrolase [Sulfitobacter donghicola DSW-25 = KCTC 12864 = JCM 14565]KIN66903.1 Alpha/beta hydrolase-like protein [Sulfitobacter donghicola DSW-25 = KCTC 12864 = JCM 14565]